MAWLRVFVVYYILLFLLCGRILVDVLDLVNWDNMIGILIGCCIGHYLGKINAGGLPVGRSRKRQA